MTEELEKLNKSQRTAMRRIVPGTLSDLSVEKSGWTTLVSCKSAGFKYLVKLGPRGAVLDKRFYEEREVA